MPLRRRWTLLAILLVASGIGCARSGAQAEKAAVPGRTITLHPGPNIQEETQQALIQARPGDTIAFTEGTFAFTQGLSLAVGGVTVRGQGMARTRLSFQHQNAGSAGLLVTRGPFVLEDLALEDAKGDALKVQDAEGVQLRRVRAEWTGGPKETNGAYGLYPVQCKDVLVEACDARGASDAGIYVGQSQNVIVRGCHVDHNVAGIEIENCVAADVFANVATANAGGILVFDLPGLPVKNGRQIRVFTNEVRANNHANFAPRGNIVASVPPGTGILLLAAHQVEVFDNTIRANETLGLAILSFLSTGRPLDDKDYNPYSEGIYLHDNRFAGNGTRPQGELAAPLAFLLGKPLPDILYDGVQDPAKQIHGKLPAALGIYLKNNGNATFADLHGSQLDLKAMLGGKSPIGRDPRVHEGELPPLPAVTLPEVP